jgi:pilin isopeptide linkage protein
VVTGTKVDKTNNTTSTVTLTRSDSENITGDQYYLKEEAGEAGKTTYKIIVPDGMALTITYLVTVNAAIGETADTTNTAYFVYEGLQPQDTAKKAGEKVEITAASAGTGTSANPSFKIYKKDQWGNPVAGVKFGLYKVTLNSDGTEKDKTLVKDVTTDANGYATFGTDLTLDDHAVYCYIEKSAPDGYVVDSTPQYFYFRVQSNLNIAGAIGIGYTDKVFDVTNTYKPASLPVSVKKTINSLTQSGDSKFGFTLKKTSGGNVYSDEKCTNAVTTANTTIKGSGTASFDTLYFNTTGTYTFTLTEDELSADEKNEGFTKDDVKYTITAEVTKAADNSFKTTSATYSWTDSNGVKHTGDLLNGDVPTFDNTLSLDPVDVILHATKKLDGEADKRDPIKAGEFEFVAMENGKEVATGITKAGTTSGTTSTSDIEFTDITYTQKDLGTHVLTIYEKEGTDSTIDYSQVKFFALVTVKPKTGEAKLTAEVIYSTQSKDNLDANGEPIFTNTFTYYAEGSLTLEATKEMKLKNESGKKLSLRKDEFTFEVYDKDNKIVATGTNAADGTIKFSELDYKLTDIGEHTYTVKEKKENEMFVQYAETVYTITVNVTDAGKGVLNAAVTKVNGNAVADATAAAKAIKFTNFYTLEIPTGVRMYIMPYILIILLACGLGIVALICKQKRRKHHA